ncbi:hypothetical protein TrLO_g11870 [Triparma laevis f. longispina]|nr:hypothetical protein TrLO_g11870 [Triparma laevis f. longispina]
MAFYLLYKVVRRDFTYQIPLPFGVFSSFASGLIRAILKFIVDFAVIIHYRHPYEIGGLYFSLNMFLPSLGLAFLLASDLAKGSLSESTLALLSSLVMILGGSLVTLFGAFLLLMNKEYRHTFLSIETGGQLLRWLFLEGDDVSKAQVFKKNKILWAPIRDKVAVWVKEGWASWEEENPDWFTDKWKAKVPENMKPTKKMALRVEKGASERQAEVEFEFGGGGGEEKGQNGRRKSLSALIMGHKAASFKVTPTSGVMKKESEVDEVEFVREMKRRGSFSM